VARAQDKDVFSSLIDSLLGSEASERPADRPRSDQSQYKGGRSGR
jgi:hypothetical protein